MGVSAGSIVMTPYNCDAEFNLQYVPAGSDQVREGDRALGLVDSRCAYIWIARASMTHP